MKKITIITPCKNGEKHLDYYIESVLSQTVKNLEYIFVNDGSTDKTEEIILSYKPKFEEKGWSFNYIKQESKGQAAAINKALKIMTGDYFSCIDSDDIIMPTFCEEMSNFLDENPQFSIVFPDTEYIEEKTFKHINYVSRVLLEGMVDNFFDEMLLPISNKRPPYACFMIRKVDFEKIYPDLQIYEAINAQNPQFIMPFAYQKKVGYLRKCLFKYVARSNSSCRVNSIEKRLANCYNWEDVYTTVLNSIPNMPEYEKAYYYWKIKTLWQEFIFDTDPNTDKKYYQLFKYLSQEKNKKILFWGASLFLEKFLNDYTLANKNILGIIDKNPDKIGTKLGEYEIFSSDRLKELNPDEIIVAVVKYPKECMNTINKLLVEEDLCHIEVRTID